MRTTLDIAASERASEHATAATPSTVTRFASRPGAIVIALMVLASAGSVVASLWLFPYLSNNHDEAVYLLQADALRDGSLFPPAPEHADAFQPWLTRQSGDHFVPKYTPVHAAFLATADLVLGSERAFLALSAAGLLLVTYLLAGEVLQSRRRAVVASGLVALSPVFLVQSATFLPYCTNLMLLEGFALCLLRGTRLGSRRLLLAAGALLGLAFFARPFDAALVALPFLGYLGLHHRRSLRTLTARGAWLLVGAVPPLVGLLAYNHAATGDPLRLPFSFLESADTVGFGQRRLMAGGITIRFTPAVGSKGLMYQLLLTAFWGFGGLVLIGLAVWALRQRRHHGPTVCVALVAVSVPLGYLFFWGTYGSVIWGGPSYLGPYYLLPLVMPLAVLGADGLCRLWERDSLVGLFATFGMLIVSGIVLAGAISDNRAFTEDDRRLNAGLHGASLDNALVFLPQLYGSQGGIVHPFALARNDPNYDGPVVYALDRGAARNVEVIAAHPRRRPFYLEVEGTYRAAPFDTELTSRLRPMARDATLAPT